MLHIKTGLSQSEIPQRLQPIQGFMGIYFNLRLPAENDCGCRDVALESGYILECSDGMLIVERDGSLKPYQ